jgi:hypothetical protein
MTTFVKPLYGSSIDDSEVARAIGLPAGVYEGLEPSISGAGGSSGWTASLAVSTANGKSLWRTPGDVAHGRYIVEETGPVQLNIAGPAANPRIDLIIGYHKWVAGPTDPVTLLPTGALTTAQMPTYLVVTGTPSVTPVDPAVPDPYDVNGNRAVILARVRVPVSGPASIERYAPTDLRLDYHAAIASEVVSARNIYPSLKQRIDAIGTAQLIEAAAFKGYPAATGGGNYQPVTMSTVKVYGGAVTVRDATSVNLTKPGLYEVMVVCNSVFGVRNTMLNATRIILGYNGTTLIADEIGDTDGDDEDQTAYALVYVDPAWTTPFIRIDHDSFRGGTMRGSVKFLGDPSSLVALGIANVDISTPVGASQTWPDSLDIALTAVNAVGAVTWSAVSGSGLSDAASDPAITFTGSTMHVSWTADPGTLPKTYQIKLQAVDSAGTPRTVQKQIALTITAYAAIPLVINSTDKSYSRVTTGTWPTLISFAPNASGGTSPYTWAVVAGADTTLPGVAWNAASGTFDATLTYDQYVAGVSTPPKVRIRCTDSAGSPAQQEKVISYLFALTTGGGGGGGGGGCVPAGTLFELANGSIPIELVAEGMLARGYDDANMEPVIAEITKVYVYEDRPLMRLTTTMGSLVCSQDHRPYRRQPDGEECDHGNYPPAHKLVPGDITRWEVSPGDVHEVEVVSVELLEERATVYHVTMDCGHVYIAGSMPAHNMIKKSIE